MNIIKINNRILSAGYLNGRQILYFAINGIKIPISISNLSCFSNRYWIDEYYWIDDEIWTD